MIKYEIDFLHCISHCQKTLFFSAMSVCPVDLDTLYLKLFNFDKKKLFTFCDIFFIQELLHAQLVKLATIATKIPHL